MKRHLILPTLLFAIATSNLTAATVKDREGAVRGDKARLENDPRWNWNDIEGGFRLAKTTGKPLLVVLRCLPCLACAGIDASVLEEPELTPLLDQFVCVRVINANTLNLSLFQYDYDLSFSAIMFNGDGTIYGRYGSWQHQKDPLDKTTASFTKALNAALAIHQGYPANKAALSGKQGGPTPYKTPVEFPSLAAKYPSKLDWDGKVMMSCVHCHMVGDAFRAYYRNQNQPIPVEWIYPQPSIETLGVILATDDVARVESVADGSAANAAGIQAGDIFTRLNGQPLVSIADVSWVLHRSPDSGSLAATIQRGGKTIETALELPAGWRLRTDIGKRVGTWPMRAMAFGGMKMDDIPDEERATLGLAKDQMALRIMHVGQYGPHAAAKKAGFQKDDILVEVGDLKQRITESAIIGHLLLHHLPGEKLPAVVLRGGKRVELKMPQQ
ncbi:Trx7/PDZ domain-containing (seleno)protein [Prosthecobacter sp.]|uniref:Trx7/PDZ domain-containing (seleno)protein n=1 Tax=Prosthecobacter sp. TaxID=1965333 RepID=UPI001DEEB053|nr:Trx7/PDZ domain-containing (seleno)protein [Prosthecobacter sp.]MCB1278878.1 PDZ domain-containing protein [Prosthecobacter sp.]